MRVSLIKFHENTHLKHQETTGGSPRWCKLCPWRFLCPRPSSVFETKGLTNESTSSPTWKCAERNSSETLWKTWYLFPILWFILAHILGFSFKLRFGIKNLYSNISGFGLRDVRFKDTYKKFLGFLGLRIATGIMTSETTWTMIKYTTILAQ